MYFENVECRAFQLIDNPEHKKYVNFSDEYVLSGDFVRDPEFPKTSTEDLFVETKFYSRSADGELIEIEMGGVAYRIANGPQTERWETAWSR